MSKNMGTDTSMTDNSPENLQLLHPVEDINTPEEYQQKTPYLAKINQTNKLDRFAGILLYLNIGIIVFLGVLFIIISGITNTPPVIIELVILVLATGWYIYILVLKESTIAIDVKNHVVLLDEKWIAFDKSFHVEFNRYEASNHDSEYVWRLQLVQGPRRITLVKRFNSNDEHKQLLKTGKELAELLSMEFKRFKRNVDYRKTAPSNLQNIKNITTTTTVNKNTESFADEHPYLTHKDTGLRVKQKVRFGEIFTVITIVGVSLLMITDYFDSDIATIPVVVLAIIIGDFSLSYFTGDREISVDRESKELQIRKHSPYFNRTNSIKLSKIGSVSVEVTATDAIFTIWRSSKSSDEKDSMDPQIAETLKIREATERTNAWYIFDYIVEQVQQGL